MNPWGLGLLLSLLCVFVARRVADLLNLSRLNHPLPSGLLGLVEPPTLAKAMAYARARLRLGIAEDTFDLVLLLAFWFAGGFAFWDAIVSSAGAGTLATGLIYIVGLLWAHDVVSLPFQLFSTFSIEARFEFNRMSVRTFVLDKAKTWLLGMAVGGPVLAAILTFFATLGSHAWLWAWLAIICFGLFFQFITPTWILPLFNKFSPLPEGELRTAIFDLAKKTAFPLNNVFVMDGSKRSAKSNAFFIGYGSNKRIALFDTLIAQHTTAELVAILAHEIGHYAKRHVLLGTLLAYLQQGAMLFLLSLVLEQPAASAAFGLAIPTVHTGIVIFAILYSPFSFLLGLGILAMSRRHEYQADGFAVQAIGASEPLSDALKKLAVANLSQLDPHPLYVALNSTHPPLLARLNAMKTPYF